LRITGFRTSCFDVELSIPKNNDKYKISAIWLDFYSDQKPIEDTKYLNLILAVCWVSKGLKDGLLLEEEAQ